jgi:hypothetical protein
LQRCVGAYFEPASQGAKAVAVELEYSEAQSRPGVRPAAWPTEVGRTKSELRDRLLSTSCLLLPTNESAKMLERP